MVRDRIREAGPDLLLRHGDPECLPTVYKHELLQALVDRYGARDRVFIDVDAEALARIADTALAPDIIALMKDQTLALDLRILAAAPGAPRTADGLHGRGHRCHCRPG